MTVTLASLMNNNTTTALTAGGGGSSAQAGSAAAANAAKTAAATPLGAVQKRVQTDLDSTKTQLSTFGVLKSAVSQSQLAAQAAGKLSATSTDADTTRALADLFKSYNGVLAASQSAAQSTQTSGVESGNAARVGRDFQRALTGPATSDALKKLGLSLKSDGALVQDAKKFADALKADPASVRAALGKLGTTLSSTAGKELDTSGAVGGTLSRLSQRSTALAEQQKALTAAAQGLAAYKANS